MGGEDYSKTISSYVDDLKCLNPRILQMIDLILAEDTSDPIIILQSDHGFRGPRDARAARPLHASYHWTGAGELRRDFEAPGPARRLALLV